MAAKKRKRAHRTVKKKKTWHCVVTPKGRVIACYDRQDRAENHYGDADFGPISRYGGASVKPVIAKTKPKSGSLAGLRRK